LVAVLPGGKSAELDPNPKLYIYKEVLRRFAVVAVDSGLLRKWKFGVLTKRN
jgi:hypothetical protein